MSHFVADVAQPMHTDSSDAEEEVHSSYEEEVDDQIAGSSAAYSISYDGRDPADAFRRTLALARTSHRFYKELVSEFGEGGYTPRVHQITARRLNRAANAIADLCAEV